MGKRYEIDGKFYRKRRGKLVEIPAEWVGKVPMNNVLKRRGKLSKQLRHRRNRRKKNGRH